MTVSLLVGTFRTLAHYTQSPGEILTAMNQRMLARCTAASPPAWSSASIPTEPSRPLTPATFRPTSTAASSPSTAAFPSGSRQTHLHRNHLSPFGPGARLTLLTDGVVEARAKPASSLASNAPRHLHPEPPKKSPGRASLRPGRRHHRPYAHLFACRGTACVSAHCRFAVAGASAIPGFNATSKSASTPKPLNELE